MDHSRIASSRLVLTRPAPRSRGQSLLEQTKVWRLIARHCTRLSAARRRSRSEMRESVPGVATMPESFRDGVLPVARARGRRAPRSLQTCRPGQIPRTFFRVRSPAHIAQRARESLQSVRHTQVDSENARESASDHRMAVHESALSISPEVTDSPCGHRMNSGGNGHRDRTSPRRLSRQSVRDFGSGYIRSFKWRVAP